MDMILALAIFKFKIRMSLGEGNADFFCIVADLVRALLALAVGKIEDIVIRHHSEKRIVDTVKACLFTHSDGFFVAKCKAHNAVIC